MERSPIKDIEIKYILNAALTDQINDREIYMKGIDHSYYYEGYVTYKTEELQGQHPLLFSPLCATLSQADKTHVNHMKTQQRGVRNSGLEKLWKK